MNSCNCVDEGVSLSVELGAIAKKKSNNNSALVFWVRRVQHYCGFSRPVVGVCI